MSGNGATRTKLNAAPPPDPPSMHEALQRPANPAPSTSMRCIRSLLSTMIALSSIAHSLHHFVLSHDLVRVCNSFKTML
jgi:hypothetical protein